jgi:hypothetical protein
METVGGISNKDIFNVLDSFAEEKYKDGDITTTIAARYWDVNAKTAWQRLNKLVEAGKLIKIRGKHENGSFGWLYRLPEEE